MIRKQRIQKASKVGQGIAASIFLFSLIANGYLVAQKFEEDPHIVRLESEKHSTTQNLNDRQNELDTQDVDIEVLTNIIRAHQYLDKPRLDYLQIIDSAIDSLTPETRYSYFYWQRVIEETKKRGRKKNKDALPRPEAPRIFNLQLDLDLARLTSLEKAIAATRIVSANLDENHPDYQASILRHAVDILPGQALLGDIDARSLDEVVHSGMSAEISLEFRQPMIGRFTA